MSNQADQTSREAAALASAAEAAGVRSVLVIGEVSHPEMAGLLPCLAGNCRLAQSPDLLDAAARLTVSEPSPELIVLVQPRPGECRAAELNSLRMLAPLAGLCAVLGSLCEGETRTGQPLSGMPRVFWHQWPAFWREQQDRIRHGLLPAWSLPATASDEERLLAAAAATPLARNRSRVVVLAKSPESARALADAAKAGGYHAAIGSAEGDVSPKAMEIVLWDASPAALGNRRQIRAIRQQFPHAALIGISTFPRASDLAAALAAGVAAVLAKPFRLEHLLGEIAKNTRRTAHGHRSDELIPNRS